MSCHHSGRWYCVENRFKRPRPRGMLADGWPRMKRSYWLVGWLGLAARPGEVIVVSGREARPALGTCFCFSKQLRHVLPACICRQRRHIDKSPLCISARKRHGHITQSGGERNGILGNGGWSWVGWSVIISAGRHCLRQASRDDVEMLNRSCRLCILHRTIADNDKCPTASWTLSSYMTIQRLSLA